MKNIPDLSNVKEGDLLFSPLYGYRKVKINLSNRNYDDSAILIDGFDICNYSGFRPKLESDGQSTYDHGETHPRYFLNLGECVKYYSELYLTTINIDQLK